MLNIKAHRQFVKAYVLQLQRLRPGLLKQKALDALFLRTKLNSNNENECSKYTVSRKRVKFLKTLFLIRNILLLFYLFTFCTSITAQPGTILPKEQNASMPKGWQWPASSDGITYIPVCWENSQGYSKETRWVKDAIINNWQAVANLTFYGWEQCHSNSRGIRILVEDSRPRSLVGYGIDGVYGGMKLNFTYNNFSPVCQQMREHCIKSIAVHEFGHALGLIHEQDRADSTCNEGRETNNSGWLITPYDKDSVMNYCNRKWNNDGVLSHYDREGIQIIYGKKPTPSRGVLAVTDSLAEEQVWENVIMNLRGSSEETGTTQFFYLNRSNPKSTKVWSFSGTGTYNYSVETHTMYSNGRLVLGYGKGAWTLTNGENWDLSLYTKDWNPKGYWNLVIYVTPKSR